jgi:hypothetical protein
LLQKHRHDGDQHAGQSARFPWTESVATQRAPGVNVDGGAGATESMADDAVAA